MNSSLQVNYGPSGQNQGLGSPSLTVPSLVNMLSNPLPPVVAKAAAPVEEVKVEVQPQSENQEKIVLILHTRDITPEEENLCRKFGSVRNFNPSMCNISVETVPANYLFVDVRVKYYRLAISKINPDKFRICSLVNSWEKHNNIFDDFCDVNMITKLPFDVKVTYKHEFDELLCNKKLIKSPGNSCLSLMSYLVNIWDELKRRP